MNKLVLNDFLPSFGSWADYFTPFIESEEMYNIYQKLKEDAKKSKICPSSDKTFRTFQTCAHQNIKVIWYLMDPYPKLYKNGIMQSTGIAMDNSNSPDGTLQPSLDKFYDGINNTFNIEVERSPNLEYLQEQGVMLINTDLTCKLNQTGSHKGLWEPFQKFFLEEVMSGFTGIIYVFSGKSSEDLIPYVNKKANYIFITEHPAAASYRKGDWQCKGVFDEINKIIKENRGEDFIINWDKKQYDYLNKPPF